MDENQQAADELVLRLEGKTIVHAELDAGGAGFRFYLDDGNVLLIAGTYIVGLYKPADETLQ